MGQTDGRTGLMSSAERIFSEICSKIYSLEICSAVVSVKLEFCFGFGKILRTNKRTNSL
jgi:hypothetical protein